ncbi:hypothetical protein K0M31_011111 [Melipona bicolor]|uniref:Uncharacterized protein n=1 Tax=Melipona bicolor TaxID=60889 RepID=A0AA40KUJ0_9HYME|nr:hypothetical protein K0M31_011111 [Melipona bicolor]
MVKVSGRTRSIIQQKTEEYAARLRVAIGWNRWGMELIGIWPEPCTTDERLSKFKTLFYLSIVFMFGVGPQSANLFFIWGDIELVTENLSMANIPYITAIMKSIFICNVLAIALECYKYDKDSR